MLSQPRPRSPAHLLVHRQRKCTVCNLVSRSANDAPRGMPSAGSQSCLRSICADERTIPRVFSDGLPLDYIRSILLTEADASDTGTTRPRLLPTDSSLSAPVVTLASSRSLPGSAAMTGKHRVWDMVAFHCHRCHKQCSSLTEVC